MLQEVYGEEESGEGGGNLGRMRRKDGRIRRGRGAMAATIA
jgi:hypothetical protein